MTVFTGYEDIYEKKTNANSSSTENTEKYIVNLLCEVYNWMAIPQQWDWNSKKFSHKKI